MENTIPKLLSQIASTYPKEDAQYSKDNKGEFQKTTYQQLFDEVIQFAAGLIELGIERGDHIGLVSDNRKEWLISDLSILSIGAADVPRGCDSVPQEIEYILSFADVEVCVVENETQLKKILSLRDKLPKVKQFIVLDPSFSIDSIPAEARGLDVFTFGDIMAKGNDFIKENPERITDEIAKGEIDDLATIIFTSGTTGEPKGVMLSHRNFLNQVEHVSDLLNVGPNDIWLAVLPVWHSFERIMQYVSLGYASAIAYSKPIGKIFLNDFQTIKPSWMAGVPRLWEAVRNGVYRNINSQGGIKKALFHFFVGIGSAQSSMKNLVRGLMPRFKRRLRVIDFIIGIIPFLLLSPLKGLGNVLVFKKIKEKLGGRFVAGISGGGALPQYVDKFFQAVGILLLEGYGLTETAPVLGVRKQDHPVPHTVGPVFPEMEIKIVDEAGNTLPPGKKGLVLARGPQIMLGYYKKPEETKKMISEDSWLNTGDLGMLTHDNELRIVGRAKDTIVLLGGENVEPGPIEEKISESDLVDHAVVLGQDQKFLAALIVPNTENLENYANSNSISYMDTDSLLQTPEIIELYNDIINEAISPANGFKGFERIYRFKLINTSFELGRELSAKQEIKRHVIADIYKKDIKELFS